MQFKIEVDDKLAQQYLKALPSKIDKATSIALLELGNQAIGVASESAPFITSNLRRSIHVRKDDNFPFLAPKKNERVNHISSPRQVEKEVWFGTNLSYARRQEDHNRSRSGFMRKGYTHAQRMGKRVFEFTLGKELR